MSDRLDDRDALAGGSLIGLLMLAGWAFSALLHVCGVWDWLVAVVAYGSIGVGFTVFVVFNVLVVLDMRAARRERR